MATLSELRADMYSGLRSESHAMSRGEALKLVTAFESACLAQGREEGAEQMKAKIRDVVRAQFFLPDGEYAILPTFVLAPKDEE